MNPDWSLTLDERAAKRRKMGEAMGKPPAPPNEQDMVVATVEELEDAFNYGPVWERERCRARGGSGEEHLDRLEAALREADQAMRLYDTARRGYPTPEAEAVDETVPADALDLLESLPDIIRDVALRTRYSEEQLSFSITSAAHILAGAGLLDGRLLKMVISTGIDAINSLPNGDPIFVHLAVMAVAGWNLGNGR
jgi:hypothetical protein